MLLFIRSILGSIVYMYGRETSNTIFRPNESSHILYTSAYMLISDVKKVEAGVASMKQVEDMQIVIDVTGDYDVIHDGARASHTRSSTTCFGHRSSELDVVLGAELKTATFLAWPRIEQRQSGTDAQARAQA